MTKKLFWAGLAILLTIVGYSLLKVAMDAYFASLTTTIYGVL